LQRRHPAFARSSPGLPDRAAAVLMPNQGPIPMLAPNTIDADELQTLSLALT
jgi:hypothetical protein